MATAKNTYPIVEYAHLIGKNTADFTPKDIQRYLSWLTKRPIKTKKVKDKNKQHKSK